MKKYIVIALVLLFSFVSADVIEPGTHTVSNCVKITNLGDFNDYVFVSRYGSNPLGGSQIGLVSSSDCVPAGRFTVLYAFKKNDVNVDAVLSWVPLPDYYSDASSPGVAFEMDFLNWVKTNDALEFGSYSVSDFSPLTSEVSEYKIASISDKIYLKETKETQSFNDGSSDKLVLFDANGNEILPPDVNYIVPPDVNDKVVIDVNAIVEPPVVEKNIFGSILCLIFGFFGMTC